MRLASLFCGPVLALLVPALARADSLDATRLELQERAHVVEMKVDRGFATLVVQRTVANPGPISDQAMFHLELPTTAVATRLRTSGVTKEGQTIWFEGELMEAEAAARKYRELTGIGGYYPKDPALLSWRSQGLLALQVFPVLGRSTKTVEYTLKVPLTYADGAYHLELPPMGTKALAATIRVSAAHPDDVVGVNGVSGPVTVSAITNLDIVLTPRGVAPLETALASVAVSANKFLVHGRIAAAPHLAEAPRGAHVVVLFDASRSHHDAASSLAAVRAYLGHMTGATVEFLTFDREVRAPLGRGLSVDAALSRLATYTPELRNGSALDAALDEADAILARSALPARRVVVVTDTLTRSELTPAKLGLAAWKSGAVLHLATIAKESNAGLERDDDSPWATLPRRTGGLFWKGHASPTLDADAQRTFEQLARPKRLDKLVVRGMSGRFSAPEFLDEGSALDHLVIADRGTSRVDVDGELWSRPLHASVVPSSEQAKLDAALFFGSPLLDELSEPEQMKLALLGRAVSPVTSYLAIEPGVRPSNEGLDWLGTTGVGEGGGGRGEGIGLGLMGTIGHGGGADKRTWLEGAIGAAARTCAPSGKTARAELETTYDEIVDVVHVEILPGRDAQAESCLREAIWRLSLPATFTGSFEGQSVSAKL